MRARRGYAVGRSLLHLGVSRPALATAGEVVGGDELARQRAGEEERGAVGAVRDPVAIRAQAMDADVGRAQAPKAERPVCARPRMSACTSCVPS